ncbi:MAG: hypothetical protein ACI4IV_07815 [Acutalibacteraceae bacterium]
MNEGATWYNLPTVAEFKAEDDSRPPLTEWRVCPTCLKLHLVGREMLSPRCVCAGTRPLMTIGEYLSRTRCDAPIKEFVIREKLWKYAFSQAGEPYRSAYSDRIKRAIAQTACYSEDDFEKLLQQSPELLLKYLKWSKSKSNRALFASIYRYRSGDDE